MHWVHVHKPRKGKSIDFDQAEELSQWTATDLAIFLTKRTGKKLVL